MEVHPPLARSELPIDTESLARDLIGKVLVRALPEGVASGRIVETEHQIYREDAVLEYPQSGERIRGRRAIQSSRAAQPNRKRFTVRRITGAGDLWVTEFVLSYDGRPSFTVSIMEFSGEKVARETQYFADPFEPGPSRAQWVERMS